MALALAIAIGVLLFLAIIGWAMFINARDKVNEFKAWAVRNGYARYYVDEEGNAEFVRIPHWDYEPKKPTTD